MMITTNINGQTRDGIDGSWIAQRVEALRRDGQSICVNVLVKAPGVDLRLTAGVCPHGEGGGRPPNSQEQQLFKIWNECGLGSTAAIAPGKLIECLKRLGRSL
jgi:hypothetical protein